MRAPRTGTVELKIPKRRKGSDLPAFLEPRRMAQKALTAACIKGVSTRKVDDLVQVMGMSGLSRSQVSRLCGEIGSFLERPAGGRWAGTGDSGSLVRWRPLADRVVAECRWITQ